MFGLLERGKDGKKSKVRASVIPEHWKDEAREIIRNTVEPGSEIYTDEHGAYYSLGSEGFKHAFVKHAEYYVDGAVHTNGIENFWSLLKRGIKGTYVSVSPFICSAISTNRRSGSTSAAETMATGLRR